MTRIEEYNQERLSLLTENDGSKMFFAPVQVASQGEALRHFQRLTPEQRTELLGIIFSWYVEWYQDQQRELERVRG